MGLMAFMSVSEPDGPRLINMHNCTCHFREQCFGYFGIVHPSDSNGTRVQTPANPHRPRIFDMTSPQLHRTRPGLKQTGHRRSGPQSGRWVLWALALLPCLIEAALQASDARLFGGGHWRSWAYQNGAFWTGFLTGWQPGYAAQPVSMFLSYAVLHAGLAHLAGNMLMLALLGDRLLQRLPPVLAPWLFILLYLGSAIGGGAGFALLAPASLPMVGASGAVFGLVGALLCHDTIRCAHAGLPRTPVLIRIVGLVGLNLLFWFAEDGLLAWQAHLGGFITGWMVMWLITRFDS